MNDIQEYLKKALKDISLADEIIEKATPDYNINEDIRKTLINERTNSGYTQKQLAEKTGLSQANISRIENGQASPSIATLKKIADSIGKKLVIEFVDFEEVE